MTISGGKKGSCCFFQQQKWQPFFRPRYSFDDDGRRWPSLSQSAKASQLLKKIAHGNTRHDTQPEFSRPGSANAVCSLSRTQLMAKEGYVYC